MVKSTERKITLYTRRTKTQMVTDFSSKKPGV
jgi:hypothetical protein